MAAFMWNNRLLVGPPVVLLQVKYNIGERAFIQRYKDILNDIDTELRLLKVLEKEIWISKRYSYKYQNSDCNMKWFRQHKMMSKACESLIRLQIGKLVISLIPETVGETGPGVKPNKWPNRQMLEYFLMKLLGFASLCLYIWSVGYKTNELLLQNMEIKNLFLRNLLQAGILSRMQIVAQHLLEKSCKWYTGLYPWLQRLPELESSWLPEGVNLPTSMEEALGSELTELRNITSISVPKKKKQNTLQRFFNLLDENAVEDAPVPELHEEFDKSISEIEGVVKGVSRTGMSLDDIFNGLVETGAAKDLVGKTGKTSNNNVSVTVPIKTESIMQTGTDHLGERLAESENFVTSGVLLSEENRSKEGEENDGSHQVQFKPKKKKKKKRPSEIDRILSNQLTQSEDIGVAVSTEEVSTESKMKKMERYQEPKRKSLKKMERYQEPKRKNRDDEENTQNNEESASKRLAGSENFVTSGGLLSEDNRSKEGEENDESHQVQIKSEKKKKKKRHSERERIFSSHLNQSEDIGVAVSTEEVLSSESKTKKKERNKQLKRKNRDDEGKVKNNEEIASKRRKPDDSVYKQMEVQSMKGSTHDVKNMSPVAFLEEDISTAPEDASPIEKTIDVNELSQDNGLDRHQNQSQAIELLTSDISQRKRKKKKKKHLRKEIATDSAQVDLLFDEKETHGIAARSNETITTSAAMTDPVEIASGTTLGSSMKKKKKKKGKREIPMVPDLDNTSSSNEITARESSKIREDKRVEQMPQNEQESCESIPSKRRKRKQKINKDETIEALNVNDGFAPKEEKSSIESLELSGVDFSSPLEMGKERKSKKKKKKQRNLLGSMVNVEPVGENGVLGMEGVRKSDADRKSKMSSEAMKVHPDRMKGIHSKALNDINKINVPSGEMNNQKLQPKFQGKVKKKRKKSKKGWKTAFQFLND